MLKRNRSSSSPDRDSSPTAASEYAFPDSTSKWDNSHLNSLQITTILSRVYTPKELVLTIVNEVIDRRVQKITKHLLSYMPVGLRALNFDDFYLIKHDTAKSLLYNVNGHQMTSFKVEPLPENAEEHWRQSFMIHGEEFCKKLIYMVGQREQGYTISEHMFQELFQNFAAMFGLHAVSETCLQLQSLKIGENDVKSKPNLVFYDLPNWNKERGSKIFAVCEVTKEQVKDVKEPSPAKTCRYQAESNSEITHLSTNLIGQIGGDLLAHFPSKSSKQLDLLGFIVQGTYVTFTQLKCSEMDFEQIRRGEPSFPEATGPKIYFSKPYNFLKADDRMNIIEPLLKIGFAQSAT